jgi:putative ABC transport system substrate-binding protein
MRRRDFVTFLSGATAWAAAARAQEPRLVIGVLRSTSSANILGADATFLQGLADAGFIEGKNISIEWPVREAKFRKSRFVPLHDSTRLALARYADLSRRSS